MDARVDSLEKSQEEMHTEMEVMHSEIKDRMDGIEGTLAKMSELLFSLHGKRSVESSVSPVVAAGGNSSSDNIDSAPVPLHQVPSVIPSLQPGRLEIPTFDGTDPVGWLARADQYFAIQCTREDLKVPTAFISMEGPALHWLRWLQQQHPSLTWSQFTTELLEEFGGELSGPPIEQLAALRQIGTVDDFANIFRARVAQIPGLAPQIQLGLFLNGLKPAICVRLRPNDVTDLRTAIRVARAVERELEFLSSGRIPGRVVDEDDNSYKKKTSAGIGWSSGPTKHSSAHSYYEYTTEAGSPILPPRVYGYEKQGLCFRCQQPYSPMHVCPNKSLRTLIAAEDEGDDAGEEPSELERIDSEHLQPDTVQYSFLDLPLTALGGIDGPKTMKFRGQVASTEVIIMVDSGASHNFISHNLSTKLQYPLEPTQQFGVKLGDGRRVESKGKYLQLPINLGPVTMTLDCFVFPLGGVDMILGVAWLETLGNIKANWARMTMTFKVGDRLIQLSGDPSLSRLPVSVNALENPSDVDFSCILWEITTLPSSNNDDIEISNSQHSQLRNLLQQHCQVFGDPQGLPPSRANDHQIVLKTGTTPVSVKPYRYGHHQKDEIERMVGEMLAAGIIQPSSSPFSSPVLLVKKKDGS
ncbi:PREDICTED: uncharacterized protein LOC109183619 [Ipomoea nil]|uniref:uncharacterized protein LOC109183619 n=1 Tax=Ipomoea nil TaxID=35883 RepID=UPI0009019125|nr:PREDICTED: uncharacterized protein LOC109183619 [Ipomoea nil]